MTPARHGGAATPPPNTRPRAPQSPRQRARAWAELLRVSALFSVPGDALAGAAAVGRRPHRATALALATSLCLYEAGMALNDWADRDEDAAERPHRPLPSGRISPTAALTAAAGLTAGGLACAARAGRAPLAVATTLAVTVWSYDTWLKHTPAGPAAMATARALDLLLGATATDRTRAHHALLPSCVLGAHTYAVTAVSRHETQGGSTTAPLTALATTGLLTTLTVRGHLRALTGVRDHLRDPIAVRDHLHALTTPGPRETRSPTPAAIATSGPAPGTPATALTTLALTALYARTSARPLLHAALNPSPPLTQRAVGGGIRAMIPLQAALAARAGSPATGLAVLALAPLARTLARKVSAT
ncbi:SCO3242 family prenyltransferase [Streptomyces sp. NPDC001941]|uniref:SCO3242 family prenyltransferase n=1 Tax=Streptomyces sp. NPDC001941 TaxID=3154659 RepID=UPI00331E8A68